MAYIITAVISFFVGTLLVAGVTHWYFKELTYTIRNLMARLARLQKHQDDLLSKVDNKRWWETLLEDIYNASGKVEEEISRMS